MVLYPVAVLYNVRQDNTVQYNTIQYSTLTHITQNNIQYLRQTSVCKITENQENIFYTLLLLFLTYLLTPWSGVLLEKLTGLQLVKKFPAFYGTRKFITAFTSTRHLSLSWGSPVQSIPPHLTSWRSILILSSHIIIIIIIYMYILLYVHICLYISLCSLLNIVIVKPKPIAPPRLLPSFWAG